MSFAIDADPRHGRFGLRTECPRCGAHLPVNGPASEVDCAGCDERVAVPGEVLRSMLDAFEDAWPDAAHADSITVGDLTWRWTSEPTAAALCPSCDARLDDTGEAELLGCSGCGAQVSSVAPPPELRRVSGLARVIGGELDQTRSGGSSTPVVLACPACGAGLTITHEHQRITPCTHCGSQVHLPDAVWRQLHPPRTVRPWGVRFQGESRPARARQVAALAQAKAEVKRERAAKRSAVEQEHRRKAEERRRAEEAAQQLLAAKLRAEQDEAAERRRLRILPLTLLSGVATLIALGVMLVAAVSFALGHTPALYRYGAGSLGARVVTDTLVIGGAVVVVGAWALGVVAAALRGGKPVGAVCLWSAFMGGLTLLPVAGPVIGLFWAWQHLIGAEPTPDTDPLPRGTGWPLAPLYLFGPAYAHLCYIAATDLTFGEFLRFLSRL